MIYKILLYSLFIEFFQIHSKKFNAINIIKYSYKILKIKLI